MRATRILAPLLIGLGLLAGCGPLAGENPLAGLATRLTGGAAAEGAAPAGQVLGAGQMLTREVVESLPTDLILVGVPDRGVTAALLRAGANGPRETWISQDGISATLEAGLVVATRGFGFDLMAADVSGIRAVLRGAESGGYVRETLDGRDRVQRETFTCAVAEREADPVTILDRRYDTTRVLVVCGNDSGRFGNRYWIDRAGTIWRSQQFVLPGLGYLRVEKL